MEKALVGIDSVVAFTNTSGLKGRGTLVHISRSVAVFEVYNPYSLIQLSEVLEEIVVMRGERVIYRGRGVVTSIVMTGLMVIGSVTLIDAWNTLESMEPGPALGAEFERFISGWQDGLSISENYQLIVNNFASFMADSSQWLEEAETAIIGNAPTETDRTQRFRESVETPLAERLADFMQSFEKEAAKVPKEELSTYKAFARREIHPYMLCAPFAYRCYVKPLGYAGDYEMVNMMLKESPDTGSNTYARVFNELQTNVSAAAAHRNRVIELEKLIGAECERIITEEQRIFTVLTIGCGPAVEIQRFIRNNPLSQQCAIHLMDFNEETIAYTTERIKVAMEVSGRSPTINFIRKSIDELLKDVHKETDTFLPTYDMIYCAGLFDYFPDNVCRNLVDLYHRWVRPGGLLVTTNVTPSNHERFTMEHLLEWYLIYRDEELMETLAPAGTDPEIYCDETGVNVFMNIRKEI